MKYLKLYENFSAGKDVYVIMTQDEKYIFSDIKQVGAYNAGIFYPSNSDNFNYFESEKDAQKTIDEIIRLGDSIIRFDDGRDDIELGEDEENNLIIVPCFMGIMKKEKLNL